MANDNSLFIRQRSGAGWTLALALVLCLGLIVVDRNTNTLTGFRTWIDSRLLLIHRTADLPHQWSQWLADTRSRTETLRLQVTELEAADLIVSAQLLQTAAVRSENRRLRRLLGSREKLADDVMIAELLAIAPNPERHEILLDRGASAGVFEGQAVLEADGLVGQVIAVSEDHCRVLLLTDELHGIPVEVNRNGVRAIASGIGESDLQLLQIPESADVVVGDMLVSSGLGDRFPQGYPVATVTSVHRDPVSAYVRARAQPTAALRAGRQFLLVFPRADPADQELVVSD